MAIRWSVEVTGPAMPSLSCPVGLSVPLTITLYGSGRLTMLGVLTESDRGGEWTPIYDAELGDWLLDPDGREGGRRRGATHIALVLGDALASRVFSAMAVVAATAIDGDAVARAKVAARDYYESINEPESNPWHGCVAVTDPGPVTDEDIRALRREAIEARDGALADLCALALRTEITARASVEAIVHGRRMLARAEER